MLIILQATAMVVPRSSRHVSLQNLIRTPVLCMHLAQTIAYAY